MEHLEANSIHRNNFLPNIATTFPSLHPSRTSTKRRSCTAGSVNMVISSMARGPKSQLSVQNVRRVDEWKSRREEFPKLKQHIRLRCVYTLVYINIYIYMYMYVTSFISCAHESKSCCPTYFLCTQTCLCGGTSAAVAILSSKKKAARP